MKKLSVILPCFNESKNIPIILDRFNKVIIRDDIEVIFVDNGSTDNTQKVLEEIIPQFKFAKFFRLNENKGYGYGISSGLKLAKGKYLSWTHADMQTDPKDIIRGLNIIESRTYKERIFVKGLRIGRHWKDTLFTVGMSIFESLFLFTPLWDINAQPNIFSRELFDNLEESPNDFSFDLYYYYIAVKNNYKIFRFKVNFGERHFGKSSWNINWQSKLKFITRTLVFTLKLILKINFQKVLNYKKN